MKSSSLWKPLVNEYKKPTVTLTFLKKNILKAVRDTVIVHGPFFNKLFISTKSPKWVNVPGIGRCIDHEDLFTLAKDCEKDVIGAILSHCILNKKARGIDGNAVGYALDIQGSIYYSVEDFLLRKQYLSALNTYFEKIDRDGRLKKSKIKLLVLSFIKEKFPNSFKMKLSSEYTGYLKGFK